MKTYYLIDYENVHDNGFRGAEQLSGKEHIHIFSSANAPNIKINSLTGLNGKLRFHKVPAGKESLDRCLVSYLGYLIHKNKEKKAIYIIVSQDRGYDRVINWWKEAKDVVIGRRNCFEIKVEEKQKVVPANKKMRIAIDVQQALAKAKVENHFVNGVASVVAKNFDAKNRKQVIYWTLLSKYGREDGLRLYNMIKHLLVG